MADELQPAPDNAIETVEIGKIRVQIAEAESRLVDARNNIKGAQLEIEKIKTILAGWERYLAYQRQREEILSMRILADRKQLRMEEDYSSGVV